MKKHTLILIVVLISAAAGLLGYILISNGFYSISADESARTLIAYYWYKMGIIEAHTWLPLHFFIMGLGFNILPDLILLPRLISLLFGLLLILITGAIAFSIFRNYTVTIIAASIAAFLPQRLILSLLPLPEIIYMFFICTGAFFLYRSLIKEDVFSLVMIILMWSTAALLRYESWLFLIVLGGYLLFLFAKHKIKLPVLIPLLLITGIVPAAWIIYDYNKTGILLSFLSTPGDIFLSQFGSDLNVILYYNPLYQFIEQNLFSLNLIGIAGIYLFRKNKNIITWLIILFIPLLLLSLISLTGRALPTHNFWRIASLWNMFLIPFTAYTFYFLINDLYYQKRKFAVLLGIIILSVMFSFNTNEIIKMNKSDYTLTKADIKTAETLSHFISDPDIGSRVLIETTSNYGHLNLVLASGDPFKFIYSERGRLTPINKEKYRDISIDYYLVNSVWSKEILQGRSDKVKLLELNNWSLYKSN